MTISAFGDRSQLPTLDQAIAAAGGAGRHWVELCRFAEEVCGARSEWAFLGRDYGWMLRYRRAGRTLVSVFPGAGHVTVLVVVGPTLEAQTDDLDLGPRLGAALREARAYPEGRWVYVTPEDDADVEAIERLLLRRMPPSRRRASRESGPTA